MSSAAPTTDKANAAIEAQSVVRHYEEGLVKALRGVSFRVEPGEGVAIIGPSGSGKTTLLHLIGALDQPTSGKVLIQGQDLRAVKDLDKLRSTTLGFVFQLHHLIPNLTLWENVALPTHPLGLRRAERKKRASALLTRVGLEHRIDFLPVKCSGGERQRAAVARALINGPSILLADEPTGSVDTTTGDSILGLFDELGKEQGVTRVVITLNPAIAYRSDRVLRIVDGELTELQRKPAAADE